jgi:hypothetical protein
MASEWSDTTAPRLPARSAHPSQWFNGPHQPPRQACPHQSSPVHQPSGPPSAFMPGYLDLRWAILQRARYLMPYSTASTSPLLCARYLPWHKLCQPLLCDVQVLVAQQKNPGSSLCRFLHLSWLGPAPSRKPSKPVPSDHLRETRVTPVSYVGGPCCEWCCNSTLSADNNTANKPACSANFTQSFAIIRYH